VSLENKNVYEGKKIPWVAWNKVCMPTNERGGLGIRDIYRFNVALVAK